ncbi:18591_t:CDS:2, partial [Gigaspora margarita]
MPQNNLSINIHTLNPTLPNVLNHEQRRRLHSVLIAIEPSLVVDARSAVRGIANEQFPKGSTMNPIKLSEYENYKESQKRIKKDNDLRNHAASRFLRGVSLTRQPKGKAEEVIKEFNKVNSTFLVTEADFVLRDWLTSYCNIDQEKKKKTIEARAKEYALSPKKKNIQPPIRRHNTNYIDVE